MPTRPSQIWKSLSPEVRLSAADAFWRDDQGGPQQMEATVAIARKLNFRPKSIYALPIERRAKQLAQMRELSDLVATRVLVAYHLVEKRPMMAAFLDALGLAHDNGVITAETVAAPDRAKLAAAVEAIKSKFPEADVDLYLTTLRAVDGETWAGLEPAAPADPPK